MTTRRYISRIMDEAETIRELCCKRQRAKDDKRNLREAAERAAMKLYPIDEPLTKADEIYSRELNRLRRIQREEYIQRNTRI